MSEQRTRILAALARGDGQRLDGFDLGHTAEVMYGDQADQIEVLIASEQRAALKIAAASIESEAAKYRLTPGDKIRRSVIHHIASMLRQMGRTTTQEAQRRYDERRQRRVEAAMDAFERITEGEA